MKGLTITLLVASVLSIAPAIQSQGRKSLKPSFEPRLLSLGVAGPGLNGGDAIGGQVHGYWKHEYAAISTHCYASRS